MNRTIDVERILGAFLAPEADRLPDRVIDAALTDIARTPQRPALRVPWRLPFMPALSRATGIAAVVLVTALGAGGIIYLNSPGSGSGGPGAQPTPTPTPAPTVAPTAAPTPQPTFDPSDPAAWTPYSSAVYGYTIAYPSDWSLHSAATHKWQPGEPIVDDAWPWADVFVNPETVDGDSIGLWVLQVPAPAGADVSSWDGLRAALGEMCDEPTVDAACPGNNPPTALCLGGQDCQAAIMVLTGEELAPMAAFGDPETGVITMFLIGRPDDFPAAARYGGTVALLKAILAQVDIREPQPGETPR